MKNLLLLLTITLTLSCCKKDDDQSANPIDQLPPATQTWQHQQMAAHYINTIANGLSQFDGGSQQLSYYKDIAWIGLWKVPDYNTTDPNDFVKTQAWKDLSLSEQNRIKNAIASFQSNENKTCQ